MKKNSIATSDTVDLNQLEKNKDNVIEFFNKAFNEKDFDSAVNYLGPVYIQHSPKVADGIEGVRNYVDLLRKQFPQAKYEIKKVFAEKNYVFMLVHFIREAGTRGSALMELFKLENNKIVEHWNVVQEVPETAMNSNGVF